MHAENSVFNNAANKPVKMGSSKPICTDCQQGMSDNKVEYNSVNTSASQSKSRQPGGKYEGDNGSFERK